jgi:IMP dehydrogenase/GMP reductase
VFDGEQAFGASFAFSSSKRWRKRTFAGFLHVVRDELIVTALLVEAHAPPHQHVRAVAGRKPRHEIALTEHGAAELGRFVLEREVPVAGGGARQVGDFALQPQRRQAAFQQRAGLAVQARRGVDVASFRGRRRRRGIRKIQLQVRRRHGKEGYRLPLFLYNGALSSITRVPAMRILEEALTFDDVLLVPAHSDFLPRDADLSTQLTRSIRLNLPILSAAMDTVTEARLAITIAQEGGLGIVHKNMSIEAQAREVHRVKKFESGVIHDPITITADKTIREVLELTRSKNISGVPVVVGSKAVGIVTHRDLRFETKLDAPVSTCHDAAGAAWSPSRERAEGRGARAAAQAPHREGAGGRLELQSEGHDHGQGLPEGHRVPARCEDERGALRVGAAVGTGTARYAEARRGASAKPRVDVIVVDTAHGHSSNVLKMVSEIKRAWKDQQIIAGNIVTAEAAKALVEAGADGYQGRHRSRLDLHDSGRCRRRRAADHRRSRTLPLR